MKTTTTIIS